jgi:membrane fusion protein (multidrug efflux system)
LADSGEDIFMNFRKLTNPEKNKVSGYRVVRLLIIIIILGILSIALVACTKKKEEQPERIVNVDVWPAEINEVQPHLEATGTLKADEEVTVSSEVDGIVRQIKVNEGSPVNKGTLLVEINEIDYMLDWKRSEAALKQAEANLANAKSEYKRKNTLYQEELITRQQFDDITTKLALAEAEVDRAKSTLASSKEKLARTKVYSPLNGAVKEKKISVGDYVRNGTPLLNLIKIDKLKLNFTISEKDVAGLKIGQEVVFSVDAFPSKQFKGRVSLLYPNVEERTRTLQAEAIVPNSHRLLKAGYFARVQIFTQKARNAVVVPITALLYDGSTIRIFVVENNKARERIVKTGGKYGEYVEIVEGLKEKEVVVVVGQNNLAEGVKVNVAR